MPAKTLILVLILTFTGVQPNPKASRNPQQGLDLMNQGNPPMFMNNRRFGGTNKMFPMINRRLPMANRHIHIDESDKGRKRICYLKQTRQGSLRLAPPFCQKKNKKKIGAM